MSKNYTIDYLIDEKIICISVFGRLDFQSAMNYSKKAIVLGKKKGCCSFIFDHRYSISPGKALNFHTSEDELQQFGFISSDKIAIVVQEQRDGYKIDEQKYRNMSWSILKYFYSNNISTAITWLTKLK
ncbi:MAG: hypothetical protein IPK06_17835 [Ignavibacteriae bacterium]|nr:hypothetical protein [Ignavibacteriota bacterium]